MLKRIYDGLRFVAGLFATLTAAVADMAEFEDNETAMRESAIQERAKIWAEHKCSECKGIGCVEVSENEWALCGSCMAFGIDVDWLYNEIRSAEHE